MILQPSEEAMTHALIREIITGEQLKKDITRQREIEAAKIAKDIKDFQKHEPTFNAVFL